MEATISQSEPAGSSVASLYALFEQAASAHPTTVALIFRDEQLTYGQVATAVDSLSQAILSEAPAAGIIGISTRRRLEMIIGVLAIIRAGKAYLPLDSNMPASRLEKIIRSSEIGNCLCADDEKEVFGSLGLQIINPNNVSHYTSPVENNNSLAYVLYTSGTTGEPKGVCVGQQPLLNLLEWQRRNSSAATGTRTLQFAALSFDVSAQEIFATLTTAGTLVLLEEEQRIDFSYILDVIEIHSVERVFLPFVALQTLAETALNAGRLPAGLREIMTAGEQLKITPQIAAFSAALPDCTLYNQYGPTECTCIVTQLPLAGPPAQWPALPTIGTPISNVELYIVGDAEQEAAAGEIGEIYIGGACLAEGYLNKPALTNEKFIFWKNNNGEKIKIYKTGDLGRVISGGEIEYLGRKDDQVKIRGYRIEIGEIEVALNALPGIKQAAVVAHESSAGPKQLVAYLLTERNDTAAIRAELATVLPDYMLPAHFLRMTRFPVNSSGKIDRKQLPRPGHTRPEMAVPYRKPATPLQKVVAAVWREVLQFDRIGLDDNFFELGGNSLLAQKTVALLRQQQQVLPITKLYQYPTIAGVAHYLAPPAEVADTTPTQTADVPDASTEIAVIGMAGRFPGAGSVTEFWQMLHEGREGIRFFAPDELDPSLPPRLTHDPLYVPARGILDTADQFDAAFFGLTPKQAAVLDPQQRIFLEIAWEALEQAGHLPATYAGRTGVFAGTGTNTYFLRNVLGNPAAEAVGEFQALTLNEKDYVASRTAYQLNLKGPAVSVYSACSTSLLAVAQAVQSLRAGQCEVALAGGASVTAPIRSGHLYEEGAMLSRDGHCRSFDAAGQGTVFSDGAGVVLLKPLAAARHANDPVYAVIKGVGVNNDGGGKGSFSAPSAEGQALAIRQALADARVEPATISYVEAHGTATPLGDPIEFEGLNMAFGEQQARQFCALGSVKSNIGHLTAAAGVAGLIKTVLALHHRQLPASLGFETPNSAINFLESPFFVNTQLRDWAAPNVRRAGVSSFGVGGTNVHVVLEEAPAETPAPAPGRPVQLLAWSAKTETSRAAYAVRLAAHLAQELPALPDVAYTLHTARAAFAHRQFVVASTNEEAQAALHAQPVPGTATQKAGEVPGEVVFLFPGQGSQYAGMGRALYAQESAYRAAVDECAALLAGQLPTDLRQVLYADEDAPEAARLQEPRYAQLALFVTEYALAQLWRSWGIRPTVCCGHSLGEFVAAHLAGVFSLADALHLVAERGRLVGGLPGGAMLAVRRPAAAVTPLLPASLALAAANSPTLCVVAGPAPEVAAFARTLEAQQIASRLLPTTHAFHSAMMDPAVEALAEMVARFSLQRPQMPIVSSVSGTWLTDAEATDPRYWAGHLRATVQFGAALETIFTSADEPVLLLEVGPGNTTATFARQQGRTRPAAVLTSLHPDASAPTETHAVLRALGQLWLHGLAPDWRAFYAGQQRQRLPLPTYVFDRRRCWLDPAPKPLSTPISAPATTAFEAPQPASPHTFLPDNRQTMNDDALLIRIKNLLESASGIEMSGVTPGMSFLEIGLDSLLLTQVALALRKEFNVSVSFRQLNEEYATLEQLAAYLRPTLPAEPAPAPAPVPLAPPPVSQPVADAPLPTPAPVAAPLPGGETALGLIAQQLQLLARQVALLQGQPVATASAVPAPPAAVAPATPAAAAPAVTPARPQAADLSAEEQAELRKPFGATARIERQATGLSAGQQSFLQQLTARYNRRTAASKAYAQQHRAHMADPRVVSGFRPLTKELVYPIVVNKSKGSRLWDLDGNEYLDVLSGFGSNMFGYQPDFIKQALHEQIEAGFEVGPQHALAGEVSALVCELTGQDRAALCNTGSEAVLGAMRVARTVTGRSLIVAFSGSYHGIVDEVLVRGTKKLKSFPAAPGILPEAVQNMLILDYGTDESLRIIEERAHELAAVLVEPVQSRRPEFRPVEFLRQLRTITAAAGTALIFDEVITGFRMHSGGTQALFGIRADLATYGKVIGGGLSIGVIAGQKAFMDALDGGFWQYGDTSFPEVGVTYFAGTFVRHPLALATAKASLEHLKAQGPALQRGLTAKAERLADTLNAAFRLRRLPMFIAQFGSLWKVKFEEEIPYSELLFTLLREKGVHIWDGFPCFITEAHTEAEVDQVIDLFLESTDELLAHGFLGPEQNLAVYPRQQPAVANVPPVAGAKLGRDLAGNPAWFVANAEQAGEYLQLRLQ